MRIIFMNVSSSGCFNKVLGSLMVLFLLSAVTQAQERTISGTVTSTEEGMALPGVNVIIQGTALGTVTDIEGNYSLNVPQDANVLVFSFIGYVQEEVEIGDRTTIDVQMETDITQLSEVVVTALGIEREERALGYAVQEIEGETLTKAREVNVVNSLSGRIAGVQVSGASGNMGGSSRILIRGVNSVAGNNQPLFVVDGVPLDNSNFTTTDQARGGGGYDYGNMAQDINPDDIASISVLKGPSAAALYGTRAANGVILITTKSGEGQRGIGVSVNSSVTIDNVYILPDYQNEYGGGNGPFSQYEGEDIAYTAFDESWGPRLDGRPVRQWYSFYEGDPDFGRATPWVAHPDNIRDFFETGVTLNNNVALSGGNENSSFRLSYTNVTQNFVLPNSELDRNTLNFSGSTQLTDRFTASISANYVVNKALGRPGTGYDGNNVMQQFNQWSHRQMDMDKLRVYETAEGIHRTWNIGGPTSLAPYYSDNPYWTRYKNYQNDDRERLFGNLTLKYDFTDWLSLTGRVMTDFYTDRREERIAVGSQAISEYSEGIREVTETNADLILNFDRRLSEDFSLNAFVGGNIRINSYHRNVGTTQGGLNVPDFYNLNNSASSVLIDDYLEERQINSVFGSASLGFRDMVYADFTLRNDWSSTLPADDNAYLYPSVSGSFVFSELAPLQTSGILSFGKLRAGWAQVGNDTDPYRLGITYVPKESFGADPRFTVPNDLNNPNLRPEKTNSWEVGADLRFFSDRIGLDVTYYSSVSTDQIFTVDISGTTGYGAQIINAGEVTNKGVEVQLRATPVVTDNFQWDMIVNWARNRNEIVELAPGINTYTLINAPFSVSVVAREGEPYGAIMGFDFVYDDAGNKVINPSGTYAVTSEQVPLGNAMPDWTGGITNTFSFRGVTASVLIDGRKGVDIFSISNMFGKYSGMLQETVDGNIRELGVIAEGVVNVGTPENPQYEPNTTRLSAIDYFQGLYGRDAAHVYDGSFIKLREVTLGYTLPNSLLENSPFRNVTFSLIGRNLALLYKKIPHLDPENTLSSDNIQGIEGAQLPSVRSWGFNLSFNL